MTATTAPLTFSRPAANTVFGKAQATHAAAIINTLDGYRARVDNVSSYYRVRVSWGLVYDADIETPEEFVNFLRSL